MIHLRQFENKESFENSQDSINKPWIAYIKSEQGISYSVDYPFNGFEAIDLGMVLSNGNHLLWAKCNFGASSEEEEGLLFQFGSSVGYKGEEAKVHSTWATTPFNNGSEDYDSEYFNSHYDELFYEGEDGNYFLTSKNDPMHINMGGKWRTPLTNEIDRLELLSHEWTSINGVTGRKFSYNNNYIFIPSLQCYYQDGESQSTLFYYYDSQDKQNKTCLKGGLWLSYGEEEQGAFYTVASKAWGWEGELRNATFPMRGVIELTEEEYQDWLAKQ